MSFPAIHYDTSTQEASNQIFTGIRINPLNPYLGAQIAEERWEFQYTWKCFLGFTTLFLPLAFISLYLALLAPILAALIINSNWFEHKTELMGHAVYCSTINQCYGYSLDSALRESVTSLISSYASFKHDSESELETKLYNLLSKANKWVFNHLPQLTKDIKNANTFSRDTLPSSSNSP